MVNISSEIVFSDPLADNLISFSFNSVESKVLQMV